MSENVPKRFRVLFWDVEFSTLNIPEHSWFIIERILEYGDANAIRWMIRYFERDEITQVVCQSRRLSRRAANFWRLLLDLPKGSIRCLSKPSPTKLEPF